jgi:hypothetical protein
MYPMYVFIFIANSLINFCSFMVFLWFKLFSKCSQDEERLFYFHIANLEHACGASLDKVSACHWDQNEAFSQFGGSLCILSQGYAKLMEHLSHGVDIRLNSAVSGLFWFQLSGQTTCILKKLALHPLSSFICWQKGNETKNRLVDDVYIQHLSLL